VKKEVKYDIEEDDSTEPPRGYVYNSFEIRQRRNPNAVLSDVRSRYLKETSVDGQDQVEKGHRLTRSKSAISSPPQPRKKSKSPKARKSIRSRRMSTKKEVKEEGRSESEMEYPSASEVDTKVTLLRNFCLLLAV
jgi:hypothetical protein